MPNEQEIIVPLEQASVSFFGQPVIAVRLPDGRVGAVISNMCNILQMDVASQVRRIREDETIADCLIQVQIETETRGPQAMGVLIAWAIPFWLSGIQLSRVKDIDKRVAIAYFKKEAANVLYAHFSQRPTLAPTQAIVPTESISRPVQPSPSAPADEWATYHEQMALFYRWKGTVDARLDTVDMRLGEVEQRQGEMESRVEGMEEVVRLVPEILERLGPQKITEKHQQQVRAYVHQLSQTTSKHSSTIYTDLYTAFSVPRYQELQEEDWPQIEQWLRGQLERAKKRAK
jgi:hypothetical protein